LIREGIKWSHIFRWSISTGAVRTYMTRCYLCTLGAGNGVVCVGVDDVDAMCCRCLKRSSYV